MALKALPAELAHFVQQALARSPYQSEEELMAEAVRVLKARVSRQEAGQQLNGSTMDTPPQTPDEYVHAIAQALDTGDPVQARTLALAGAERYPPARCITHVRPGARSTHGHGRAGDAGLAGRGQGQ